MDKKILSYTVNKKTKQINVYSKKAFELISTEWLHMSWEQKYSYIFTWFGRPIIQLPGDMIRIQEVIYKTKPDIVIETGVAHGGSLIFYASLLKVIGNGRVIGIDIEIKPHNREAIESHELFSHITLIEGSSTDKEVANKVKSLIKPGEKVLVILDSNHTKDHVLRELELYSKFVSLGSYIVATDGIIKDLYDVPRGNPAWVKDNPLQAIKQFIKGHKEFKVEIPKWQFNESALTKDITHWPNAWLKRISDL